MLERPVPRKTEAHPPGMVPSTRWARYYDWPSHPILSGLIRHRAENGYDDAIFKVGKNYLIDPAAFWEITRKKARGAA